MRIHSGNNRAKFHPDPIWNDGALGFLEAVTANKKKHKSKMSSDVGLN